MYKRQPPHPVHHLPPTFLPFSSCPWVIHISSLASTFPILFLPSPVYFLPTIYATYSLYLSPLSPPPTPLLITLHVISISVILSCSKRQHSYFPSATTILSFLRTWRKRGVYVLGTPLMKTQRAKDSFPLFYQPGLSRLFTPDSKLIYSG